MPILVKELRIKAIRTYDHNLERLELLRLAAAEFADKASSLPYLIEVALVGSTAGNDPYPNDLDLAVVVEDHQDLSLLVKYARQISRHHHSWEVFIFDVKMRHLGRLCFRKECPTRSVDCLMAGCGRPAYLRRIKGFKYQARQFLSSPVAVIWKRGGASLILKKKESLSIRETRHYEVLKDLTLKCINCGEYFAFPAAKQKSFAKNGFSLPKRCPKCLEKEYLSGARDF